VEDGRRLGEEFEESDCTTTQQTRCDHEKVEYRTRIEPREESLSGRGICCTIVLIF
jgi:hypothetical protein